MKIAVLSDIHGNHIALARCVEYALSKGVETFFFLGDYVGELAYPERTMELLYRLSDAYDCTFIKGNKEIYWQDYRERGEKGWEDQNSTTGALLYGYRRLTGRDLAFFGSLPITRVAGVEGLPQFTLCHGSPKRVNEDMRPDMAQTYMYMETAKTEYILCGHTHEQLKMAHAGRCLCNPGSVGMPLQSGGRTQFLVLDGAPGQWKEEFISLEYDVERVIAELREERMEVHAPGWTFVTQKVLRTGKGSHGTVLKRAMELCRQEQGSCDWPQIPERFWQQAIREMQD